MKLDEYVTTLVISGRAVPVGIDDAGQTYFFEYVDNEGNLVEECCGSYNTDYKSYIEYKFGIPDRDCPYFDNMNSKDIPEDCLNNTKYGYCDKCFFQNVEWSAFQKLVNLGIVDYRGNVQPLYEKYLSKKEEGEINGKK